MGDSSRDGRAARGLIFSFDDDVVSFCGVGLVSRKEGEGSRIGAVGRRRGVA